MSTDAALVDFFSYGGAICAEGPTVFAAPAAANAAFFRNSNGCADTDRNVNDFATAAADPRTDQTPAAPCNLAAPASTVQFEMATATVLEDDGVAVVFVTRTGDTSGPATVQYSTSDNVTFTNDRTDYTTTFGTLNFAAGETSKRITVLLTDDVRPEGNGSPEHFIIGLANPTGAALAANKQAYALDFVQRPEFLIRYPQSFTAAQFVDNLNAAAGDPLSQAERDQQVANLTAANNANGRAAVLAAVIEDTDFRNAEFNRAFVLMKYFGYLRRNPFDTPNTDFNGYDFWLSKLNAFGGNYIQAEMVKAFITSDEYRNRFTQ